MNRKPKPPTLWDRARVPLVAALTVSGLVLLVLGALAYASICFFVVLMIVTFSGGGPKEGGFHESGIGWRGP